MMVLMQSEHAITGSLDSSPYIEEQYRSTQNVFTISEHTKSTSESTTKSKWMRRFKVFALGKKRRTTRGSRQLEQQQQQHILTTDHLDTTTTSQENTHIVVNHEEIICHPSSDIIEEIESSPPAALPMPEGNRRDDEEIGRRRRRHRSWSTLSRQLGYILRRPHHERTEQVSTHQSNSQTTQITTLTHAHSHTWPLTAAHTTTPFRHQTVAGPTRSTTSLWTTALSNRPSLSLQTESAASWRRASSEQIMDDHHSSYTHTPTSNLDFSHITPTIPTSNASTTSLPCNYDIDGILSSNWTPKECLDALLAFSKVLAHAILSIKSETVLWEQPNSVRSLARRPEMFTYVYWPAHPDTATELDDEQNTTTYHPPNIDYLTRTPNNPLARLYRRSCDHFRQRRRVRSSSFASHRRLFRKRRSKQNDMYFEEASKGFYGPLLPAKVRELILEADQALLCARTNDALTLLKYAVDPLSDRVAFAKSLQTSVNHHEDDNDDIHGMVIVPSSYSVTILPVQTLTSA